MSRWEARPSRDISEVKFSLIYAMAFSIFSIEDAVSTVLSSFDVPVWIGDFDRISAERDNMFRMDAIFSPVTSPIICAFIRQHTPLEPWSDAKDMQQRSSCAGGSCVP